MRGSTLVIATAIVLAVCAPIAAAADQDQQVLNQRAQEAKRKLQAAEAAQGAQRQKLMKEHMSAMQEIMSRMRGMRPHGAMTPVEQQEWMIEHQKLMDQLMEQLMDEHHLLMKECRVAP
jgi:hypothetical protein